MSLSGSTTVYLNWLVSPIMEIAVDHAFSLCSKFKEVNLVIISDPDSLEGNSFEFTGLFFYFSRIQAFKRLIKQNQPPNLKLFFYSLEKTKVSPHYSLHEISLVEEILNRHSQEPLLDLAKRYRGDIAYLLTGIASSTVSYTKNLDVSFSTSDNIASSMFTMIKKISIASTTFQHPFTQTFSIFNGRFASSRAIAFVHRLHNKTSSIRYYERSHSLNSYVCRNFTPHNRLLINEEMKLLWNHQIDKQLATRIGEQYFLSRLAAKDGNWFAYSRAMHDVTSVAILNDRLESTRTNNQLVLSYFTSSEEEFAALGQDWNYSTDQWSQTDVIDALTSLSNQLGFKLIIRAHPNLHTSSTLSLNKWQQVFLSARSKDAIIISYDSLISSYDLLDSSDIVVVYGSTVGVESMFLKKPTIVCGPSFYGDLSVHILKASNPADLHHHLYSLIQLNKWEVSVNAAYNSSIIYGFWAIAQGTSATCYHQTGPLDSRLFNTDIDRSHTFLAAIHRACLSVFSSLSSCLSRNNKFKLL